MYLINTKTNEALQLAYDPDGGLDSPREWDNLVTLWLFDNASSSDDGNHPQDMDEALINMLGEPDYQELMHPRMGRFDGLSDTFYQLGYKHGYLLQPVTRFEHSQVRYYRGAGMGFDYAVCGMIFVALKDIRQEYQVSRITKSIRQRVLHEMDAELETFTNYVNGEVYSIEYYADANDMDLMDSVSGIYLSDSEFPDDPKVILKYGKEYMDLADVDNWVPAKADTKVVLEPEIAAVQNY